MNSDEIWLLQLWSGVIGSFVSAVLGGLVALLVVRLTNGQQRRNAAEAREIEAIAEFISLLHAMQMTFTKLEAFKPREHIAQMGAAVVKIHMAGAQSRPLAIAIDSWPVSVVDLGVSFHLAEKLKLDLPVDVQDVMRHATVAAMVHLRSWHGGDDELRAQRLKAINEVTEQLVEAGRKADDAIESHKGTIRRAEGPDPAR